MTKKESAFSRFISLFEGEKGKALTAVIIAFMLVIMLVVYSFSSTETTIRSMGYVLSVMV